MTLHKFMDKRKQQTTAQTAAQQLPLPQTVILLSNAAEQARGKIYCKHSSLPESHISPLAFLEEGSVTIWKSAIDIQLLVCKIALLLSIWPSTVAK